MFIQISKLDLNTLPEKISPVTLYSWARRGKYPSMFKRIGGKMLVDYPMLVELLTNGETPELFPTKQTKTEPLWA